MPALAKTDRDGSNAILLSIVVVAVLVPAAYWPGLRDATLPPKLLVLQLAVFAALGAWFIANRPALRMPPLGLPATAYLLVCALNPSGWLGIGTGRRRNLPLLPARVIKNNTQRAGLTTECCISLGLGGLGLTSSGKKLPGALTLIGNINLVYCRKQRLSGEIRRLKFRFPRRVSTVSTNPGVYSKTGT